MESALDLVRLLAFPSEDRIDRLQRLIRCILKSPASLVRRWRSLFGHLASMIQLVPAVWRHIQPLQYFVQERWDSSMPVTTSVVLSSGAWETLQWWLHPSGHWTYNVRTVGTMYVHCTYSARWDTLNLVFGVPFSDPVPELMIVTHASSYWETRRDLLARVPIQEIMDAAAWKTAVTFARHYLKDLPNLKGHFGQAIISTAGSSGGTKTTIA